MSRAGGKSASWEAPLSLTVVGAAMAAVLAVCLLAPMEETMGNAQRIVYVHVSVAWLGLLGFALTAGGGFVYLLRRDLAWDHWAEAAAELGWLCSGLTLLTGSLWARQAWGTWWTWDPRLTTAFVLWAVYSGYLIVRASLEDPHRRARLGAVLAIAGLLDVPLVVLAARWFRGIHPVSPEMEPSMRMALLATLAGFSLVFAHLLVRRRAQLALEEELALWEREAGDDGVCNPMAGRDF